MASSAKNIPFPATKSSAPQAGPQVSPQRFFDTANAYQQSAALSTAVELEIFTAISEGNTTAAAIAKRVQAAEKGVRVLCDYLSILGFLSKKDGQYANAPDSAAFLVRTSPMYVGNALGFLHHDALLSRFKKLTAVVRNGGAVDEGTVTPEAPHWVDFAKCMAGLMVPVAEQIATILEAAKAPVTKVLDIAAGHGMFGLTLARRNPGAQIYAVDWKPVLAVAQENAQRFGVADRYNTIPGSAFDVEVGSGYDVVLLTNILHHFDAPTNEKLLRRVHAALKPGGKAVTVEFVPNEDRVTPATPAAFSIIMLTNTAGGDAYTFRELDQMFRNAGFGNSEAHAPQGLPSTVIVTERP